MADLQNAQAFLKFFYSFRNDLFLSQLKDLIESGRVTLEELGLSEEEYQNFDHMVALRNAQTNLEKFRIYDSFSHLGELKCLIESGQVTLEELGLTQTEFDDLEKEKRLSVSASIKNKERESINTKLPETKSLNILILICSLMQIVGTVLLMLVVTSVIPHNLFVAVLIFTGGISTPINRFIFVRRGKPTIIPFGLAVGGCFIALLETLKIFQMIT